MATVLYFIRHGQTDWNAEQRFQGQRDVPLNDFGRSQAARNGRMLSDLLAKQSVENIDFVSSPLWRTRETMEILRSELGLEIADYKIDDRLKELSFGDWEGRTIDDLKENNPEHWNARRQDKWNFVSPGGESYANLRNRIEGFFSNLKRSTIVVSHGGVNRALRSLITGDTSGAMAAAPTPQDKIMVVTGDNIKWV